MSEKKPWWALWAKHLFGGQRLARVGMFAVIVTVLGSLVFQEMGTRKLSSDSHVSSKSVSSAEKQARSHQHVHEVAKPSLQNKQAGLFASQHSHDGESLEKQLWHHQHSPPLNEVKLKRERAFTSIPLRSSDAGSLRKEVLTVAQAWAQEQGLQGDFQKGREEQQQSSRLLSQTYYEFPQMVGGVPVDRASIQVMVQHTAKGPVVVRLDAANAPVPKEFQPQAKLSEEQAIRVARQELSALAQQSESLWENRNSIQKIAGQFRYVKSLRFQGVPHTVVVDLQSGEAWRRDATQTFGKKRSAGRGPSGFAVEEPATPLMAPVDEDTTLTLQGRAIGGNPDASESDLQLLPLKDVRIEGQSGHTFTDQNGWAALDSAGQASVKVKAALRGKFARVMDADGANLALRGEVQEGQQARAVFNDQGMEEKPTAQVTAYYHVNKIRDYLVKQGFDPSRFNFQTLVRVNLGMAHTGKQCNANYYAGSVNFFRQDKVCRGQFCISCRNSAYNDIIYHEYGHLVDDVYGGVTDGGLSEGWGDVLAVLMSGDPNVGEDFLKNGEPVRRAENNFQYMVVRDPHVTGLAWVGFVWQLRKRLVAKYGETEGHALTEELVLPSYKSNARDIPAAAAEVLARDDNDGDLSNGSPHMTEIMEAAQAHGLQSYMGVEVQASPGIFQRF